MKTMKIKTTEYLFNKPASRYPEMIPLAERRIADGKAFLSLLSKEKNGMGGRDWDYMDYIQKRYARTEKAIALWQALLDEHTKGEEDA